jgi:2'-hydroxyisoflavone reductase
MKLLLLGGPRFVGRHVIDAALARGHEVTAFNRGSNAELYPQIEHLRGDRSKDLSALDGRRWDAVIDTCGFLPDVVRVSAQTLRDSVRHYTFVSSISVYDDFTRANIPETAPLSLLTDEQRREVETIDRSEPRNTPAFLPLYGALKAECERVVEQAFAGRAAIVRPGLIVGPYDTMDRFPYWITRVAEGGDVLAPGRRDRPVQVIDARDLAEWMVSLAERRSTGTFNATGPDRSLTMSDVLDACRQVAGSDARWIWVDEDFLLEHKVGPWEEMPMWIPERTDDAPIGILRADIRRAIAAGLTFRPIVETARDTLAWKRPDREWRSGIPRERETELLRAWAERAPRDPLLAHDHPV